MTDGLVDILDDLKEAGEANKISVGDVLEAFEHRSLGAILTVLGAVAALPVIGGIPGMSIFTGTLVLVSALQFFFTSHGGLWAPARVKALDVEKRKFASAVNKARPYAGKVDAVLKPRLRALANEWAVAICAVVLALTFYPLAVVPWGVMAPAVAVMMLGLSLIGRDGVFALIGYALAALTAWLIFSYVL